MADPLVFYVSQGIRDAVEGGVRTAVAKARAPVQRCVVTFGKDADGKERVRLTAEFEDGTGMSVGVTLEELALGGVNVRSLLWS